MNSQEANAKQWPSAAVFAAIYVVLSLSLYFADSHPGSTAILDHFWKALFVLGPPVALLHETDFLWFYLCSSAAGGMLLSKAFRAATKEARRRFVVLFVLAWLLAGFISTGIMI